MKIALRLSMTLLAFLILPASSYASKNIYSQCGIGAMIFTNTGWAAATSNIVWDLGTTASSSASSSEESCKGTGVAAAKFVHVAYANIEEEMALGQGAHLDAMLDILGCDSSARPAIISELRTDFMKKLEDATFAVGPQVQKSEAFFNNLMETVATKHAKQCG